MNRPAAVLAAWAAFLGVLAGIQAIWGGGDPLFYAIHGGAAALTALIALWITIRSPREGERLLLDSSIPTAIATVGAAIMVLGIAGGLWLVLIGAELVLIGAFGLGRERLAARRRYR